MDGRVTLFAFFMHIVHYFLLYSVVICVVKSLSLENQEVKVNSSNVDVCVCVSLSDLVRRFADACMQNMHMHECLKGSCGLS